MKTSQVVLWIPQYSGNRTAFLSTLTQRTATNFDSKNENGVYPVAPFSFWTLTSDGKYYSENPNCGTAYRLLEVPSWFSQKHLDQVSNILCKNLDKNYGKGSEVRVIKMGREDLITAAIENLK